MADYDVVVRPLDDNTKTTLGYIECALGMLLSVKNDLDDGQQEMVGEALRRIEQVVGEL